MRRLRYPGGCLRGGGILPGNAMAGRGYSIEARMLLGRGQFLQGMRNLSGRTGLGFRNEPRLTLVYDFEPLAGPSGIIEAAREVSLRYGSLGFGVGGIETRSAGRGHVAAFRIDPGRDLAGFRRELYGSIRGMIREGGDAKRRNADENFWFHVAIASGLRDDEAGLIRDAAGGQPTGGGRFRPPVFRSEVVLITLVDRGRISREYDRLTDRILDRRQALSDAARMRTLAEFRKRRGLEKAPGHAGPGRTWLMSDTHFDHGNIIGYTGRPFLDAAEMNRILESNWNNTVHGGDRVYFLGDMAFGRGSRSKEYWLGRLNGRIEYVRGNHDTEPGTRGHAVVSHGGYDLLLVHDPDCLPIEWDGWVVHGDKHNNHLDEYPLVNPEKKTVNVCAELVGYAPVSLDRIAELISANTYREVL